MQLQRRHPLPSGALTPLSTLTRFSSPTHQLHHKTKLEFAAIKESRFCISFKRMSKSSGFVENCGGLVRVIRCQAEAGEDEQNDGDRFYMRRCVEIARKAIGCTSPNPMVGCVIVKGGKVVGEGFHPKAGQPHAEVFALRNARDQAENATAYVSLEPCNHYGRTPPCTEALIKAKVKRVVVGMVDPNPIVACKGVDRLRDAGIDVTVGVEEELCKKLNEAYIHMMLLGNPYVTLRYSISVNGRFLDQLGEGVTRSGGYYSRLLQEYNAVILSSTSSTGQFSVPISEEAGANQPRWIIISRTANTPIKLADIATETTPKVIIFPDEETTKGPETAEKGIETVVLDRINLKAILDYCKRQGLCSVMLDLRGNADDLEELVEEGIDQNLLQKIVVEVMPVWDWDTSLNSLGASKTLEKRLRVKNLQPKISGESVVLEGYF